MITLKKDSRSARLFLLCLKNPMARADYDKGDGTYETRTPEFYIENGTTLCHFFWACFWLPLFCVFMVTLLVMLVTFEHIDLYHKYGTPGLFVPSGFMIGSVLIIGIIMLAIFGADKVGLLAYLKALKEKVCPRMTFIEKNDTNT